MTTFRSAILVLLVVAAAIVAGPRPCAVQCTPPAPAVQVERIPPTTAGVELGELPVGTVFELATGRVFVRVTSRRAGYIPPGWETGIPCPPAGWVCCVDLADGAIMRLPATWTAWPVASTRIQLHADPP